MSKFGDWMRERVRRERRTWLYEHTDLAQLTAQLEEALEELGQDWRCGVDDCEDAPCRAYRAVEEFMEKYES